MITCAQLSDPDVLVELTGPSPDRRGTLTVGHRLDEPAGFAAALDAVRAGV